LYFGLVTKFPVQRIRSGARLKTRGGHKIVSIDEHLPEAEASMMDTMHLSDSAAYDLAWASTIVNAHGNSCKMGSRRKAKPNGLKCYDRS